MIFQREDCYAAEWRLLCSAAVAIAKSVIIQQFIKKMKTEKIYEACIMTTRLRELDILRHGRELTHELERFNSLPVVHLDMNFLYFHIIFRFSRMSELVSKGVEEYHNCRPRRSSSVRQTGPLRTHVYSLTVNLNKQMFVICSLITFCA